MRHYKTLPHVLMQMSFILRLIVATGSIFICVIVFFVFPPQSQKLALFVVPAVLIAWMFKKSGIVLFILCLFVWQWCYQASHYNTFLLPFNILISLFIDVFAFFIIGILISDQRALLDLFISSWQHLSRVHQQQQSAQQHKDEFLQNINHELRTPLTAIYGYLELLLDYNERIDASTRRDLIEHSMQGCDELQLLVNNVLDTMSEDSKGSHQLHVEEIAVIDIVHEVLERFDPKTVCEHDIYLSIPTYIFVLANPQYLRQVIRNLLANAFKYVPSGTPIYISAGLYGDVVQQSHPSPEICISVKDEGPGISPEEIPLLFRQFVRLQHANADNVIGSGLGLYISKQFVEAMGGHIWVESEGIAGRGACFNFTLPCVLHPSTQAKIALSGLYTTNTTMTARTQTA